MSCQDVNSRGQSYDRDLGIQDCLNPTLNSIVCSGEYYVFGSLPLKTKYGGFPSVYQNGRRKDL